jgi:peptidyl-prolyl cis-trans isomerase SurA
MLRLLAVTLVGLMLTVAPSLAATKATVNGVPISDVQISQRVKLMKLEGGGSTQKALVQLSEDQLKLQEAKRLGVTIADSQVDDAFQTVARNVKLSTDKLREVLAQNGVNLDTMRERLRAALAWQAVSTLAIKARIQISDVDLDKEAEASLSPENNFDYILKEVLFVSSGKASAASRTSDANRYRNAYKGCDSAVDVSLGFTDAAVRDMGRRHATQLPDAISAELAKLNVGGITKPRVVETGVSMLAICAKESAKDLTFIKSKLRNEQGSKAMDAEAEKYLEELKKKAQISYN